MFNVDLITYINQVTLILLFEDPDPERRLIMLIFYLSEEAQPHKGHKVQFVSRLGSVSLHLTRAFEPCRIHRSLLPFS